MDNFREIFTQLWTSQIYIHFLHLIKRPKKNCKTKNKNDFVKRTKST